MCTLKQIIKEVTRLFLDVARQEAPSWEWTSATRTGRSGASCPRTRSNTCSCWSSLTSFWPEGQLNLQPSDFQKAVHEQHQPAALSPSRVILKMKLPGRENKTVMVVGIITHDVHAQEVPKPKVCTLCVTIHAHSSTSRWEIKLFTFQKARRSVMAFR